MRIGLSNLYYAEITETNGEETYSTPIKLAPAVTADMSVNTSSEVIQFADDGEYDRQTAKFKDGKITLGVTEIGTANAAKLTGAVVDNKGILVDSAEDQPVAVAIGFKSELHDGGYEYVWLYRVTFSLPAGKYETKADSVKYQTQTIEGTISRRKKTDTKGKHPWRVSANSGDTNVDAATLAAWFTNVPEPTYTV